MHSTFQDMVDMHVQKQNFFEKIRAILTNGFLNVTNAWIEKWKLNPGDRGMRIFQNIQNEKFLQLAYKNKESEIKSSLSFNIVTTKCNTLLLLKCNYPCSKGSITFKCL